MGATLMALLGGSGVAFAQSVDAPARQASSLSWSRLAGAESCPALRDVARRVDAHLGGAALVAPSAAKAFIDASIEPVLPQGFRVRITLTSDADRAMGVRELVQDTGDCAEATDAAALAIALMIDPTAGQRPETSLPVAEPPPVAAPPAVAPRPPAAPAQPECPRPVPQAVSRSWRARVALGPVGAVGQLPHLAWGAFGSVRLSPATRRLGVDVLGFYLGRQRAELRTDAGGHFTAAAAGLAGWWAPWRQGSLAFSVGAGAQVGSIVGTGFGFTARTNYAQSWLLNASLDADLAWTALEPWGVLLRGSLGFPLWRDTFQATQGGQPFVIFKPAPAVAFLTLGVAFEP